ncbi:MAG: 1-acyl-sn-glycerol-3-phosphate acyltransferase [Gammaproteobacteria bacterium]|nr:1-acyl-sn-glycerol-3-phosphate acyltransferase [Gammaproteobacteria bacterium]
MNWVTPILNAVWGVIAWLFFALACLFSLVVALLVPGLARRQPLFRAAVRAVFIAAGVPVTVNGAEHLPQEDCVVVANHASYVDGPLLKGYLPARFNFVIKGELRNIPIAHFLLRRAGTKFVERKEHSGSSRDARRMVKAALVGESLAVFPEGTFRKEPGVGRFRAGAFVAAVRGGLPVVPVAIRGTRYMLPSGRILPRWNRIVIDILPPIMPHEPGFTNSRHLAEASRQRVLQVLGEPDLLADGDSPAKA